MQEFRTHVKVDGVGEALRSVIRALDGHEALAKLADARAREDDMSG